MSLASKDLVCEKNMEDIVRCNTYLEDKYTYEKNFINVEKFQILSSCSKKSNNGHHKYYKPQHHKHNSRTDRETCEVSENRMSTIH